MKHLLILISFLLLSSPVFGDNHKGGTLYLWDTSSGKEWKYFGVKQTHPLYKGDVENGEPNGLGLVIFPRGNKYVGEWENGVWNGHRTYTQPNGYKYVGEYKDTKFHGQGTRTFSSGKKYVGEWKNGKPWNGIEYDKNGNILFKVVNGEIK